MTMDELNRNTLEEALDKLPTYCAPEGIWDEVESQLQNDKESHYGRYWMAAAAILIFGLVFAIFSSSPSSPEPIRMEAEEAIDSTLQLEPFIETHVNDSIQEMNEKIE